MQIIPYSEQVLLRIAEKGGTPMSYLILALYAVIAAGVFYLAKLWIIESNQTKRHLADKGLNPSVWSRRREVDRE